MYKFLVIGFLVIITSCKYNTVDNQGATTNNTLSKVDSITKPNETVDHMQRTVTFNERIESIPGKLKPFIPTGYDVICISSGDANLDGLMDKIMVLQKVHKITSTYVEEEQEDRLLLLLLVQIDKTYKLTYRNDNAVYCLGCGGVFGDPFIGIAIKNGYFSIEHGQAGGQHWEQIITFKYDKAKRNWFLYKDHFISYKLNESVDKNAEALVVNVDKLKTVKDFGVVPFSAFNIYNERGY